MKIAECINIISKTSKILELYKNSSIDEALDNIFNDLTEYKKNIEKQRTKNEQNNSQINFDTFITELNVKDKDEMINELDKLTKKNLINIISHIGLKMKSDSTKIQIINEIVNHFSFIQLNNKISERKSNSSES